MTDPWSRMISYHFLNQTNRKNFFTNDTAHGAGQLWSDVPLIPVYQQHQAPFPIIVADSRPVGSNLTTLLSLDPTVYEVPSTRHFLKQSSEVAVDISFGICILRPKPVCGYEPHLRRHAFIQRKAGERNGVCDGVRPNRFHHGD